MKAEIIVKNGVVVVIPEDITDMDVFWQQIANRPAEAKPYLGLFILSINS